MLGQVTNASCLLGMAVAVLALQLEAQHHGSFSTMLSVNHCCCAVYATEEHMHVIMNKLSGYVCA